MGLTPRLGVDRIAALVKSPVHAIETRISKAKIIASTETLATIFTP